MSDDFDPLPPDPREDEEPEPTEDQQAAVLALVRQLVDAVPAESRGAAILAKHEKLRELGITSAIFARATAVTNWQIANEFQQVFVEQTINPQTGQRFTGKHYRGTRGGRGMKAAIAAAEQARKHLKDANEQMAYAEKVMTLDPAGAEGATPAAVDGVETAETDAERRIREAVEKAAGA